MPAEHGSCILAVCFFIAVWVVALEALGVIGRPEAGGDALFMELSALIFPF